MPCHPPLTHFTPATAVEIDRGEGERGGTEGAAAGNADGRTGTCFDGRTGTRQERGSVGSTRGIRRKSQGKSRQEMDFMTFQRGALTNATHATSGSSRGIRK